MYLPNYNQLNEWPLQFLRTGVYHRSVGYLNGLTNYGIWWSSTIGSITGGRYLGSWASNVYAQDGHFRGLGFALRGVTLSLPAAQSKAATSEIAVLGVDITGPRSQVAPVRSRAGRARPPAAIRSTYVEVAGGTVVVAGTQELERPFIQLVVV